MNKHNLYYFTAIVIAVLSVLSCDDKPKPLGLVSPPTFDTTTAPWGSPITITNYRSTGHTYAIKTRKAGVSVVGNEIHATQGVQDVIVIVARDADGAAAESDPITFIRKTGSLTFAKSKVIEEFDSSDAPFTYQQEATKSAGDDTGTINYTITPADQASIADDGTVTFKTAGTYTITATKGETPKYTSAMAQYTLTTRPAFLGTAPVFSPKKPYLRTHVTFDTAPHHRYTLKNNFSRFVLDISRRHGKATIQAQNVVITANQNVPVVVETTYQGVTKETSFMFLKYCESPQNKTELRQKIYEKIRSEGNKADLNLNCIDTHAIRDMSDIFDMYFLREFNGDISQWDTSNVTNMAYMFRDTSFNGDISQWDTSQVTNMAAMFHGAKAFNGDISRWDISKVTNMRFMFGNALAFNGDISGWNTSKVTDMSFMFIGARVFNGDISTWNTQQVTTMRSMFNRASAFNSNIRGWKTGKVTDMRHMFYGASVFDHDLSGWNVAKVTSYGNFATLAPNLTKSKIPNFK